VFLQICKWVIAMCTYIECVGVYEVELFASE